MNNVDIEYTTKITLAMKIRFITSFLLLTIIDPTNSYADFASTIKNLSSDEHLKTYTSKPNAVNATAFALHPSWYQIKRKAENDPEFYGTPMSIKEIDYAGKKWKCGNNYCYTYQIIINRPGNDNGSGIVYFGTTPFEIQYWVGNAYSYESDALAAITGGYDISKLQTRPKELILSFDKPFVPGNYNLKIAPFPFPSTYGSTFSKFIEYYRHDYKSSFDAMDGYLALGYRLKDVLQGLVLGKIRDVSIDALMLKVANQYGVYLSLEIPAVMPNIIGMDVENAHNELLQSSLKPEPRNWECMKTAKEPLIGKVFESQYRSGQLLKANEKVRYSYYCAKVAMPNIKGMNTTDASNILKQLGLTPAPAKLPTHQQRLNGKVFKQQFDTGDLLIVGQGVAYKFYEYEELKLDSSIQAGSQCPKQNPGNIFENKWDNNNNPKDGAYILCNYFHDGALSYQAQYANNKKEGLILMYQNNAGHRLANSIRYSDGKRNGITETYAHDKNKYYLLRMTSYNKDKATHSKQWYSNGKTSRETTYDEEGKAHIQYNYAKNGKLTYCTEWNDKRQPMDCKTKIVRHY